MNLRPRRSDPPDINLTPLIDVVFLLLIFFMVSTTFKEDARIKVQLPEAQGEEVPTDEPHVLEITIDREGRFYVNERTVVDRELETLKKAIAGATGEDRELPVVIKADAKTPHQAVMTVMDAASQLGLLRFAFAATRPDETP
ncbi:MAG: biopolymer transporter ExbD [Pseudomonadota bacterium]|nr:biopolymer transporter ExbD [Pseudomonadota bacterium]